MNTFEFKSLFDLLQAFPTEQSCIEYLELCRWKNGIVSPYDPASKVYNYGGGKYRCKNTGLNFNVKTGTVFQKSKVPLIKWFVAIWFETSHKKGISSIQLSKDISVTQKTAWHMLHRIRECFYCENDHKLDGEVELDETFVGGKNKNRHANKKIKNSQGRSFKDSRPDLAEKYGIQSGDVSIIVECGEKFKVLSTNDLVSYDINTYESYSVAEEKLTASIMQISTDDVPKVYFLTGYSDFTLSYAMQYLNMYLQNEINEIASLDILSEGKVPDDCDTLVITTPSSDFDELTTNAIIDYINSGRNILWLNSVVSQEQNFPNVNKILAMYGVNPFEVGGIRETDSSKMVYDSPDLIMPEVGYHTITEDIINGLIFLNATKINLVDDTALEELNVTETDILTTSEDSYFRTNFSNSNANKSDEDEAGPFLVGAELEKTITEANEETGEQAVTSKLIIYGENYFISDVPLSSETQAPLISYRQNKDLVLNSIAYLCERDEDITARKNTGSVTYTATELENNVILAIIFVVPVIIIIIGIIVWIKRQRKK